MSKNASDYDHGIPLYLFGGLGGALPADLAADIARDFGSDWSGLRVLDFAMRMDVIDGKAEIEKLIQILCKRRETLAQLGRKDGRSSDP